MVGTGIFNMVLRRVRTGFFLSSLITACVLSPAIVGAQSGLFGFLTSNSSVSCKPRDRACILDAALDITIKNFESREVPENTRPHAERGGKLLALVPESDQPAVRERWQKAGADEQFLADLTEYQMQAAPTDWITVDVVTTALETQSSPNGTKLSDFLDFAFKALLENDPDGALELFDQHVETIWYKSYSTMAVIFDWMANNHMDAIESYAGEYKLPKSTFYDPRDGLSQAAATLCGRGDTEDGERLLTILERDKQKWQPDRDMQAMDWSRMTTGILACRGEAAALALVDPVLQQMQADLKRAEAIKVDSEREFVMGVIRSRVAESMIQPITLHMMEDNRRDEAMKVFVRLPVQQSTMTLGDVAKGPTAMQFPEQSFNEFLDLHRNDGFYSSDPAKSLTWYVETHDPHASGNLDYEMDAVEIAGKIWQSDISRRAAEKILKTLAEKAEKQPDLHRDDLDLARLQLAGFGKRLQGCDVTDDFLNTILARIPGYKYGEQRSNVLIDYIRYLDTPAATSKTGICLLQ